MSWLTRRTGDGRHRQVPAKVTAYVDEGIKDLVEVLNSIPKVCTTESCEGSDNENAYVFMNYEIDGDNSLSQLINFVQYLVDAIRQAVLKNKGLSFLSMETRISIEWLGRSYPVIVIELPKDRIREIISVFSSLPHGFSCSKGGKQV
jgi:hypothetical protein